MCSLISSDRKASQIHSFLSVQRKNHRKEGSNRSHCDFTHKYREAYPKDSHATVGSSVLAKLARDPGRMTGWMDELSYSKHDTLFK